MVLLYSMRTEKYYALLARLGTISVLAEKEQVLI